MITLKTCAFVSLAIAAGYIAFGGASKTPKRNRKKKRVAVTGLANIGNSCFLNSLIQCLASCPSFCRQMSEISKLSSSTVLVHSLNQLLSVVNHEKDQYIHTGAYTNDVFNSLRTHGWVISSEEQDAHELFHALVSTLEDEVKSMKSVGSLLDVTWYDCEKEEGLDDSVEYAVCQETLPKEIKATEKCEEVNRYEVSEEFKTTEKCGEMHKFEVSEKFKTTEKYELVTNCQEIMEKDKNVEYSQDTTEQFNSVENGNHRETEGPKKVENSVERLNSQKFIGDTKQVVFNKSVDLVKTQVDVSAIVKCVNSSQENGSDMVNHIENMPVQNGNNNKEYIPVQNGHNNMKNIPVQNSHENNTDNNIQLQNDDGYIQYPSNLENGGAINRNALDLNINESSPYQNKLNMLNCNGNNSIEKNNSDESNCRLDHSTKPSENSPADMVNSAELEGSNFQSSIRDLGNSPTHQVPSSQISNRPEVVPSSMNSTKPECNNSKELSFAHKKFPSSELNFTNDTPNENSQISKYDESNFIRSQSEGISLHNYSLKSPESDLSDYDFKPFSEAGCRRLTQPDISDLIPSDFESKQEPDSKTQQSGFGTFLKTNLKKLYLSKFYSSSNNYPEFKYKSQFKGCLANFLQCKTCHHKNPAQWSTFESLSLCLPSKIYNDNGIFEDNQISLEKLLDLYISPEDVDDVQCDNCSKRCGKATRSVFQKQLTIGKLPQCICFHVQRTTWLPNGMAKKRTEHVSFPKFLNMEPYTYTKSVCDKSPPNLLGGRERKSKENADISFFEPDDDRLMNSTEYGCNLSVQKLTSGMRPLPVYRLQAVIQHVGDLYRGHFITYRRGPDGMDDKWFYCSDAKVKEVPFVKVRNTEVYMIIYERIQA